MNTAQPPGLNDRSLPLSEVRNARFLCETLYVPRAPAGALGESLDAEGSARRIGGRALRGFIAPRPPAARLPAPRTDISTLWKLRHLYPA